MIDGMYFAGARATWNLQHSALPDAPVVPDQDRQRRRGAVRAHISTALRRAAERLDPAASRPSAIPVGPPH